MANIYCRGSWHFVSRSVLETAREPTPSEKQVGSKPGIFYNFLFFKAGNEWRLLDQEDKDKGASEFISAVEEFSSRIEIKPYSTLGLREDADFLLWLSSASLEPLQHFVAAIFTTGLGGRLAVTHSYLSMTRESIYTRGRKGSVNVENAKYLFVYPFVKTREWYLMSFQDRQKIMNEHFRVGSEFPNIKINTSYSLGIDDQDFVLAFETDSPGDFQTLVMRLRETESSRYTVRDTPMFTCVKQPLKEIITSLG